ncbi:ABC transporter substrate-binding protein [Paracoccus sp. JM45]|uniref:ABC transporter substrate-binding protein n=1 Tax=Paracoccus sp. JM45 TaxID=2283626 RepID=UPI000E6BD769|nr:ABC transporter substrate-binding protein [Paracoccus sp. JM45]RJE78840.1 hypothetical protein DWB67_15435 [Paracoccus sp. JM45]
MRNIRFGTAKAMFAATVAFTSGVGTSATAQDLGELVAPLSISYYAADFGPRFEQSSRILASEWEKLGLELNLEPIQFSTFVSTINVGGGLEDIAFVSVGSDPDRVDPTYWTYDQSACGQRRNASKWCDETYSALADAQRSMVDQTKREAAVKELQQLHFESTPWWPVTHNVFGMLWNNDKWGNVLSPSPVNPAETQVNPWLNMKPLGDDRILDWGYFEDVNTYNPLAEEGAVGWVRFIFDTFGKIDSDGSVMPWAAESWEFIDDTTLRIKLRAGMTFHDGKPVTADDAVFTLNKVIDVQPPSMAARIVTLDSAEMVDDLTFDIKMKMPDASFVTTGLPFLFILPKHLWENYEGDILARDVIEEGVVIGSGPFSFKEWRRNEVHELETHKAHWAAAEYDGLRRLSLGQPDAIRSALLSGQVDLATGILPTAAMDDLARQNESLSFVDENSHGTTMVWVNNEKAPFNDLAFRQALRQSTNKDRVIMEAHLGFANKAGSGPIPNQLSAWYDDSLPEVTFDIEAARQILADAGYGWDKQGRLHYPAD